MTLDLDGDFIIPIFFILKTILFLNIRLKVLHSNVRQCNGSLEVKVKVKMKVEESRLAETKLQSSLRD